jgi:hypothetical protein
MALLLSGMAFSRGALHRRPPAWSRERWIQMCFAARRGMTLPPISVYRAGGKHYVRDGHHRVSVARALHTVSIEAEVVELYR